MQRSNDGNATRECLWKKIEAMTPEERIDYLCGADPVFDIGYEDATGYHAYDPPIPVIPHTELWLKVRRSFNLSPEWKAFRARCLERHTTCSRCGQLATVVHHRPPQNLDATVINEGFLAPLKDTRRFETLCQDCHYREHEGLIAAERPEEHARYLAKHPGEGLIERLKKPQHAAFKQSTPSSGQQVKRTVRHIGARCPICEEFCLNRILRKSKIKGKVHYRLECRKCGSEFRFSR